MHVTDRSIPPQYQKIDRIDFVRAQKGALSNGVPLYIINTGKEDFVKLDVVFNAGSRYQDKPLVARFTNDMLDEGTKNLSSEEISRRLDYYGAYLQQSATMDFAELSLITPNKYFRETLAIFSEIMNEPAFTQDEFELMRKNDKQSFQVRSERVDFISSKGFKQEVLHGHPYGQYVTLEDFDKLNREDLVDFYRKHYKLSGAKVILSGKVKSDHRSLLNKYLGKQPAGNLMADNAPELISNNPSIRYMEKPGAVQSTIRIGKVLFNKQHPDYQDLQILVTLLGGYFGSRLMSNLREDKGYTYGIYSMVNPFQLGGYFLIKADVGKDVDHNAKQEIYKELRRLRQELPSQEEVDLVTSYFRGQLLRLFNGIFQLPESLRGVIDYGLDYSYYENYLNRLEAFTPGRARELAEKYLHEDSMSEVIAGDNKEAHM